MMTKQFFKWVAWASLFVLIIVTVSPIGLRPETMSTVSVDRAAAFAFAGFLFALAYPGRWLSLLLFMIAAAYGIEALQELSPTRHAELGDATVKACGAAVGVVAGQLVLMVRRRLVSSRGGSDCMRSLSGGTDAIPEVATV